MCPGSVMTFLKEAQVVSERPYGFEASLVVERSLLLSEGGQRIPSSKAERAALRRGCTVQTRYV